MNYLEYFTDIHCHILPGLDDGAKDLEQTKAMCMTAYDEGIRTIVVTPHNYASHKSASLEMIRSTVKKLEEHLKEWGLPILLYAGNEIYYRSGIAEALEQKQILTLADSRYVLVEFDPYVEFSYLRDGVGELARYGYFPILAHVERYDCLYRKKERIQDLRNAGIYFQVNASTCLEKIGSEYKKRIKMLIKKNAVDFIGTDAHSNRSRAPKISQSAAYLYRKIGKENAEKILFHNPKAVLEDRRI